MRQSRPNSDKSELWHKRAEEMRKSLTLAETMMKNDLEKRGFKAQIILYGYIADYYHPGFRMVVELDGKIHDKRKEYDNRRNEVMKNHGLDVRRFTNDEVYNKDIKIQNFISEIDGKIKRGEVVILKSTKPR